MEAGHIEFEPAAIEAIAKRVAQLLSGELEPARLVDAATVADRLGVDRDWVYSHADDLGAIRLGGPNGRLRFDMAVVRERLAGEAPPRWRRSRRQPRRAAAAQRSGDFAGGRQGKIPQRTAKGQRPTAGPTPNNLNGKEPR